MNKPFRPYSIQNVFDIRMLLLLFPEWSGVDWGGDGDGATKPKTHLLDAVYFHVGIAFQPLVLLLPVGGLGSLFDVTMTTIADHTQYGCHQGEHGPATIIESNVGYMRVNVNAILFHEYQSQTRVFCFVRGRNE